MITLFQSTHALQQHLEASNIPSAVIGGLALAVWGEPRLTRDVDLKVLLDRDRSQFLLEILRPVCTCLAEDPLHTLSQMGFIFTRDRAGNRVDILLGETAFDAQVIERSRSVEIEELPIVVCTAEDLIIYKLISTRPRDHEDARSVIKRQGGVLDDSYVLDWLSQFEEALTDSTLVANYKALRGL